MPDVQLINYFGSSLNDKNDHHATMTLTLAQMFSLTLFQVLLTMQCIKNKTSGAISLSRH